MKAIMISIQPKYVADILNGNKTLEIRKTCPEIFKRLKPYEGCSIDVYIYCTKKEPYARRCVHNDKWGTLEYIKSDGKVVAKFTLNNVEEIKRKGCYIYTDTMFESALLDKSCLDLDTICHYLKHEEWQEKEIVVGYAWHIDNLVVFDKPKELSDFKNCELLWNCKPQDCKGCRHSKPLTRAPQSWQFIEV